jgi:hypothetical protein
MAERVAFDRVFLIGLQKRVLAGAAVVFLTLGGRTATKMQHE